MQYSIVNLSEVKENSDFRIDAEYWKPEFSNINKLINKYKFEKLLNNNRIITDGSHKVREYKDSGVLFLRVQDIFENNIEIKERIFISEEENKKLNRSEPEYNKDILITKTGKIGVATVFTLHERANIPADIAILKNNSHLNSFFISTFINSKYGKLQFIRNQSGLGRPRLVLNSFDNLIIPLLSQPFQQSIADLVNTSYTLRQSADELYKEAEEILLEELGLKNYQPQNKKCFVKMLSDTQEAGRIDAEYFQPKYEDVIDKIKKYKGGYDILYNIAKIKSGSLVSDSLYSCDKCGVPYIRVKDLNFKGQINKDTIIHLKNFISTNETIVNEDDFVIATIGTVGKISIIDNSLVGAILSNNTYKISLNDKQNSLYYLLLFQSFIFQQQIERQYTQTAKPKISDNQLYSIIIPLYHNPFNLKFRQRFSNLLKTGKNQNNYLKLQKWRLKLQLKKMKKLG